jgi:prepilin-type N-terminal cleavage/methylation domain-containing protein
VRTWRKHARTILFMGQKGFSLIELLIVVAILLTLAAIEIPRLLQARIAADEAAAISTVRTLSTAEASYLNSYPSVGYAATLPELGSGGASPCAPSASTACLIDNSLANAGSAPGKQGYIFSATGSLGTFLVTAVPVSTASGVRSFCVVADNIPRVNPAGAAITTINSCLALQSLQ